jgi:hypothetical protein
VSDLKPDRQRRVLHKSNLPVTYRKIEPVFISQGERKKTHFLYKVDTARMEKRRVLQSLRTKRPQVLLSILGIINVYKRINITAFQLN